MSTYFQTARLLIRDFILEDAADLREILGDAETMKFSEEPYDLEKTEKFLSSFCIEKRGALAAVHKESGKMIGYILFNEQADAVYEIGWFFNRSFWGQGYAYEACGAVIDYGFNSLSAQRIFAETTDTNKSLRLMKKLGMHFEGVQSDKDENCGETPEQLHIYGLTFEQWKKHT